MTDKEYYARPVFMRIKQEGICCIEIDISKVSGFTICPSLEADGEHLLLASMGIEDPVVLHVGKIDACHALLNTLHEKLDIEIVDIL